LTQLGHGWANAEAAKLHDEPSRLRTRTDHPIALSVTTVRMGARDWRIQCVDDQSELLGLAERFEHPPYGLLLWEASVALARWLHEAPELVAHKRVLELGAGVGFPGLVARSLGAAVWQTDHLADALVVAESNARENAVTGIERFVGDWARWTDTRRYDIVLGADILYEPCMHAALVSIFQRSLAPAGCLLLADPGRPQAFDLLARLEHAGARFDVEVRTTAATCPYGSGEPVDVALLRGTWANLSPAHGSAHIQAGYER
jgi:predicted nicotinamide N-methyase